VVSEDLRNYNGKGDGEGTTTFFAAGGGYLVKARDDGESGQQEPENILYKRKK